MAWDKKYRIDFKDIFDLSWWAFIEDETAGTNISAPIQPTGDPFRFNFLSNGEDTDQSPIHGSTLSLNIYSNTEFEWVELYNYGNLVYKVSVYYGIGAGTLYWTGFINSEGYQEPYDGVSYPVMLSASDGLGQLKYMPYKYRTVEDDDTYYEGRRRESQIVIDILAKIRFTGFTEYVNVYEDKMAVAVTDSPMSQIMIDVDAFRDKDCYEVLSHILRKYKAIIRQVGGEMVIYRPVDLREGTIYGRKFVTATNPSAVSLTTEQLIDRNDNPTDLRSTDGGTMTILPPIKKTSIIQDYGYKDSMIDNWQLNPELDATFRSWTGGGFIPMGWALPNETNGVALVAWNSAAPHGGAYITQTFGPYINSTAHNMVIEFEYAFNNFSAGSNTMAMALEIKSLSEGHYLYPVDANTCAWWHTYNNITVTLAVPKGFTGWTTYRRDIPTGLPEDGEYVITLWAPSTAGSLSTHGFFRNIRFIETSDEISVIKAHTVKRKLPFWQAILLISNPLGVLYLLFRGNDKRYPEQTINIDNAEIVEKEYVKTNSIKGIEASYDYILGDVEDSAMDNVIEQFAGSLAVLVRTNQYRVDTITLTGTTGDADITCDNVARTLYFAVSPPTLAQTAADFVTNFAAAYTGGGVIVTSSGADIIFTSNVLGAEFTGTTSIVNAWGNLSGTVALTTSSYIETLEPTTEWNTRGNTEGQPLLEIVCDEIAAQGGGPRQVLSLPIVENNSISDNPQINIMRNFQDSDNYGDGEIRPFFFSSGEFDVRNREWNLNLVEIKRT